MLLENINSNLLDMTEMISKLHYYKKRNVQLEKINSKLSYSLTTLSQQNEQMSINILKDQEKIADLKLSLQECREETIKRLQVFDLEKKKLNHIINDLELKNEETIKNFKSLKLSNDELLQSKSTLESKINNLKSNVNFQLKRINYQNLFNVI